MKTLKEIGKEIKELQNRMATEIEVVLPDYHLEGREKIVGGEVPEDRFWDVVKELQRERHPSVQLADAFGRYIQAHQDDKIKKKDTIEKMMFLIEQLEFFAKEGNGKKIKQEDEKEEEELPEFKMSKKKKKEIKREMADEEAKKVIDKGYEIPEETKKLAKQAEPKVNKKESAYTNVYLEEDDDIEDVD